MKLYRTLAVAGLGVTAIALTGTACQSGTTTVKPAASPSTTSTAPTNPSNAVLNAKFGVPYALHYIHEYNSDMTSVYADYSLTVNAPTTTTGALSQYGSKPTHGHYVVFRAAVATGQSSVTYNVMDFSVRNAANEKTTCGTGEDTLGSGTLHAGQTAAGTVICDVGATNGTLVFDPSRPDYTGSLVEWPF